MMKTKKKSLPGLLLHHLMVVTGSAALTLLLFMVLPLMQTISRPPENDLVVQNIDTALTPPPPAPEEPPPVEQEPEPEPPALAEESQPLDLAQLELAMNPGFSDNWLAGDFALSLNTTASQAEDVDALFALSDLDQKPRVIYQPGPILNNSTRKKAPGTVYIIFIVDRKGRVVQPKVQKSTDTVFEKPALQAVKQWKFEPGKRSGRPVRFRMRVPITFPKGR